MIESISLDRFSEVYSNIDAIDQESETIDPAYSSIQPSALHSDEIAMESSKLIQAKLNYLVLEKEADDALSRGFQSDCINVDEYYRGEHKFFRNILDLYYSAAFQAIKLSQFQDAARLMEKEASVVLEKFHCLSRGFALLLSSWTLYQQMGDLEKMEIVLQKLSLLADNEIDFCRTMQSELIDSDASETDSIDSNSYETTSSDDSMESSICDIYLVHALLRKAEMLEITSSSSEAIPLYDEIGQLCLDLDKKKYVCLTGADPALIAGLCFEKDNKTQDQAHFAYEKVFKIFEQFCTSFPENGEKKFILEWYNSLSTEEVRRDELNRIVGLAPNYLEASLASLRCGRKDLFAKIIELQIIQFISYMQSIPKETAVMNPLDTFKREQLCEYMKDLIRVSKMLLGSSALSEIETLMQEVIGIDSEKEPSLWEKQAEMTLFNIYTASKKTSVKEMINLLNQRDLVCSH